MSAYIVEKDWATQAGLRAVVVMGSMGFRCGYVAVGSDHPLYRVGYSDESDAVKFPESETIGKRGLIPLLCCDGKARLDVVFDVHGGLTFAGGDEKYPVAHEGLWWFGFDCGHLGDAPSDEYCDEQRRMYPDKPYMWRDGDGEHRSLSYCSDECESLAHQLIDRVAKAQS